MTDDRVETHVVDRPTPGRRRPPGGALPGVLGAAARRGAGRRRGRSSALEQATPAPGRARGDHRRRPGRCCRRRNPVVSRRHDPRRARASARRMPATAAPGGRPLPHRRRRSHVRGMADQLLAAIGVEVERGGGRPSTTAPAPRRGARRLAGRHRATPASVPSASRPPASRVPGRAAADDRPRRHRRDGRAPRCDLARRCAAGDGEPGARSTGCCGVPTGLAEVAPGRRPGRRSCVAAPAPTLARRRRRSW